MQRMQIEQQLLEGCRRLAAKGFLNTPADSFSMRVPGAMEMILTSGHEDWGQIARTDLRAVSFFPDEASSDLHASIYQARADVGAVAISSPKGVRLIAQYGGQLPPIFDEQVRHIGLPVWSLEEQGKDAQGNGEGGVWTRGERRTAWRAVALPGHDLRPGSFQYRAL